LLAGDAIAVPLSAQRRYWLQVAVGEIAIGDRVLRAGDALGFVEEAGESMLRGVGEISAVFLFDLPM
jgi:redox-sensitive bicupin YhaK (pirin superfamily)